MLTAFLQSEELSGLFIDALVADREDGLLFLSAWGSESLVQQTRARLSLPVWEGQLRSFWVRNSSSSTSSRICLERNKLDDITGRPLGNTLFAHVTQLWIYNRLALAPDNANHCAVLLRQHSEEEAQFKTRIWQAVQVICPIPLHPAWEFLLDAFVAQGWVTFCQGFQIDACCLDFSSSDIESFITEQVQSGTLMLPQLQ